MERGLGIGSLFAGAVSKVKAEDLFEPLQAPLRQFQSGWVIPALLLIAPAVAFMRRRFDSGRLEHVHDLLDQVCERTFFKVNFELPQHRRVTLFKYRRFCIWRFPWILLFSNGFLVPLERSGSDTRKTSSIFKVFDNGEQSEGVAGRVWSANENIYVGGLPDIVTRCTEETLNEYATKTFYPRAMLAKLKKKPTAQSLMGIPVHVGNKKWGVLVIDCVHPKFNERKAREQFSAVAKALSAQLKGL
jgi:hypothetical protein